MSCIHGLRDFGWFTGEGETSGPRIIDVQPAGKVISEVAQGLILHAGPPIDLADIPGPLRGGIIGALILEGRAKSVAAAESMIESNGVEIAPCHHYNVVGAMAGVITASTPLVVVQYKDWRTYSPLNEGTEGALRYGSYDATTIERARWMSQELQETLSFALRTSDEVLDMVSLASEGLRRGDECHNRLQATTTSLLAWFALELTRYPDASAVRRTLKFVANNGHFGLPFIIAGAKALSNELHVTAEVPVVTTIAANGVELGIKIARDDRWYTAPSPVGEPLLEPGYTLDDLNPTMGDSLVAEVVGLGAFAMTAAPAIARFVGGSFDSMAKVVEKMRTISLSENKNFLIPQEDFRGSPTGICPICVVESGTKPVVNNGLTHKDAGVGRIGAGVTELPLEPFISATNSLNGM